MLDLKRIRYFKADIPFTLSFKHGAAERNETESVFVEILDYSGLIGYGEGCPRSYVTGESIQTAKKFYATFHHSFLQIKELKDLRRYLLVNKEHIDANPAAWCALEMALLDLLAKTQEESIESLLDHQPSREEYTYSAILGDSSPEAFKSLYQLYRQQKFVDFKVKLSDNLSHDREKLECMLQDSSEIRVRADANNLWSSKEMAIAHLSGLPIQFTAIEEPIRSNRLEELYSFVEKTGIRVILDESFLRFEQIERLAEKPENWIVNARVSKLGGILRSLTIIEKLVSLKIDVTVGAQVGESSLLTRAALLLADTAGDCLCAQEGGFGTLLLEKDPFGPMLQFGEGGRLKASQLNCRKTPGFGLNPVEDFDMDPCLHQLL